jgi:hypothetical protein
MGAFDAERLARLLAEKIAALPSAYAAEVEAFVDRVVQRAERERGHGDLAQRATAISEPSFAAVWDNPDNAVYDAL